MQKKIGLIHGCNGMPAHRRVTIESKKTLSVNVDGETSDAQKLDYRSRAKDLWVHLVKLPGTDLEEL